MIRFKMGLAPGTQVEIEGEDEKDLIRRVAFFSDWPKACPECGAAIRVQYRHPQNYEFFGLECLGETPHETTFGTRKDGTGLFYKDEWKVRPVGGGDDLDERYDDYAPEPPQQQQRSGQRYQPASPPRGRR